jgi:N6-adenosine-specific RNA methylase IME4
MLAESKAPDLNRLRIFFRQGRKKALQIRQNEKRRSRLFKSGHQHQKHSSGDECFLMLAESKAPDLNRLRIFFRQKRK